MILTFHADEQTITVDTAEITAWDALGFAPFGSLDEAVGGIVAKLAADTPLDLADVVVARWLWERQTQNVNVTVADVAQRLKLYPDEAPSGADVDAPEPVAS